jgi:hypothetical protein
MGAICKPVRFDTPIGLPAFMQDFWQSLQRAPVIHEALSPLPLTMHLNNLLGPGYRDLGTGLVDVSRTSLGTGQVDATLNWWKCAGGSGVDGCRQSLAPAYNRRPRCRSLLIDGQADYWRGTHGNYTLTGWGPIGSTTPRPYSANG